MQLAKKRHKNIRCITLENKLPRFFTQKTSDQKVFLVLCASRDYGPNKHCLQIKVGTDSGSPEISSAVSTKQSFLLLSWHQSIKTESQDFGPLNCMQWLESEDGEEYNVPI